MQSLFTSWSTLDAGRRLLVLVATVGVFALILFMAKGANMPNYALLYGGLEGKVSGDVIAALEQRGAVYDVRGNGIYVEASQRDSLRMSLAGEGLPAVGGQGYELLDSLTGFGTTSQMFDAAYWRAKEGEIARTIITNPAIRSARVHISPATRRPFARGGEASASVTVQTTNGGLAATHVNALQFLIAAAVPSLSADRVAVIDSEGGLLSGNKASRGLQTDDARTSLLRERAERLLAARVGAGNAVVELSIDTVMESESIRQRTIDPDSRVAISTDVQENSGKSQDSRTSNVTVASNVPAGDGGEGGGSANNENSETRALTNYEISETQRDVVRAAGAVRRMTVAVLINDVLPGAQGEDAKKRSEEELNALKDLVASAVGLDEERGDVITLHAMQFEEIPELGTEVAQAPGLVDRLNVMQLIQVVVLGLVALVLGLFVIRPLLTQSQPTALPSPGAPTGFNGDNLQSVNALGDVNSGAAFPALEGQVVSSAPVEDDPVARLRDMISEREPESLQVLQSWMENDATGRGA